MAARAQLLRQPLEMPGLAEEIRLVGGQQINADLPFGHGFRALDQGKVLRVGVQLVVLQAPPQARADQCLLAFVHADARVLILEVLEVGKLSVGDMQRHDRKNDSKGRTFSRTL